MKKLLASSALALIGFASAASAQSVLERVLGEIDNSTNLAKVNGTFANIAENVGSVGTQTVYVANDGTTISQSTYDAQLAAATTTAVNKVKSVTAGDPAVTTYYFDADNDGVRDAGETSQATLDAALTDAQTAATVSLTSAYNPLSVGLTEGINGSVTNVLNGLDTATMVAAVGSVTATEFLLPTISLGNISTTVLGAVNTGEITLGVNQSVDQAKTTSTGALSSVVNQLGGSADTGALVLNVASNMTGVNGAISNTMTGVNGSVGSATTTVLGAVNTGTITSGVNAAVAGIVGGGTSQSGGFAPVVN